MEINTTDIKKTKTSYPKSIISLTPEDDSFIRDNHLSPTKIMREAIKYLRENGFKEGSYKNRQKPKVVTEQTNNIHPENCEDTLPKQQHLGTHPEVGKISTETEEEKGDSFSIRKINSQQVNSEESSNTSPSLPLRKKDEPLEGGCGGDSLAPVDTAHIKQKVKA